MGYMAVYLKGYGTKRDFVTLAYKHLLTNNASSLTVKDIANEKGYSAPSLYKHFKSLEYLLVVASVKFLDEYMYEYAQLLESDKDPLRTYVAVWKLFNRYAFERPDIYYRLFWGQHKKTFTSAIREYFELFPFSGYKKCPGYFYLILVNDSIQERDLLMLRRVPNRKLLSDEDAVYFSKTNPLIVKGLLIDIMDQPPDVRKQAEQECNYLIEKNLERITARISSRRQQKSAPSHYGPAFTT
jgi:AcrR family transcriptional regulator